VDTEAGRTAADREAGRSPRRTPDLDADTAAVLALGSGGGLFGDPRPPRTRLLEAMGTARWSGELAVAHLGEAARQMRSTAFAVRYG
jgi:hypothetical protein